MKVSSLTMKVHARTMEIHNLSSISWKSGKIKRFFLGKVAEMAYFCLRKVEILCWKEK